MDPTAMRLANIRRGDAAALADAFNEHRSCLRRIIAIRMDRRLRGRVDVEDILQESFLSAADRCGHLVGDTGRSLFLWLRMIVLQTLADIHRRHLLAQKRAARRECRVPDERSSANKMTALAGQGYVLAAPSDAVEQLDLAERLLSAMTRLAPADRQVLALRHIDELTNLQVAQSLGINPKAASIRYARALRRLKRALIGVEWPDIAPGAPG